MAALQTDTAMTKAPVLLALIVAALTLTACSREETPAKSDVDTTEVRNELAARAGAPLFEGMGTHHHPITTSDPDAQRYFDQGLIIDFAFNHAESVRSFRAAQTLDSTCAMCYWGEALALGPNINVTSKGIGYKLRWRGLCQVLFSSSFLLDDAQLFRMGC